jgi:uncharacterized protein YqgQ
MDINNYNDLINVTKTQNRAISRTNINIEAFKKRIEESIRNEDPIDKEYGSELILIFVNHIVQTYFKSYGILGFPDGKERLWYYKVLKDKSLVCVGTSCMDKERYYLSRVVIENIDMLSGILNYVTNKVEEDEFRVLELIKKYDNNQLDKSEAEIVTTTYQIVTVGCCLGYFDVIINEQFLESSEKPVMKYFKFKHFLIKYSNRVMNIDIFNGDLICGDKIIKFETWSNYSVKNGLDYLINIISSNSELAGSKY